MRVSFPLFFQLATVLLLSASQATDAYLTWASSKWGAATVGNPGAKATVWGENADPDKDGLPNLLEYTASTDPTRTNPASDCFEVVIPATGPLASRYPHLFSWQRTDDPDLRVTCQISSDLFSWFPEAPADFTQPLPRNLFVSSQEMEINAAGLRRIGYFSLDSMAGRPSAFMRLHVARRDVGVAGPGIQPFAFTNNPHVLPGSLGRSNAVVLDGFAGSLTINIPLGVTLYVNGVPQTGTTATVKAGDTLWMEAIAPGTVGQTREHTLSVGGQTAKWTITVGDGLELVPDHPGPESGYTPVEVGVSDTGASQVSMPIIVAPGTGGMQPQLSINYTSQSGNGPLGAGFSLSGLSSISRMGRTILHDGVKGGIGFDANDRFALDGQRLLVEPNQIDGADGSEYKLEFDPTQRIRSYGSFGNGPARWVVETKAGLTMEYASRIAAPSNSTRGKVKVELFTNIEGKYLSGLENSPNYPSSPNQVQFVNKLDGVSDLTSYGQRITGFIIPKNTGSYRFFIAANNEARLKLDADSAGPSGLTYACFADDTPPYGWQVNDPDQQSQLYSLIANQAYAFEIIHTGDKIPNHTSVAWTGPGVSNPTLIGSEYLASADPGIPTADTIGWALTKISDSVGNTVDFTYDAAAMNRGELQPSRITYTANPAAGLSPQHDVVFEYADRPDTRTGYLAGLQINSLKRLAAVESRSTVGSLTNRVRRYEFFYRDSVLSGSSLLTAVDEIDPAANRKRTSFTWRDGVLQNHAGNRSAYPPQPSQWSRPHAQTGDFNGDGFSDLFSVGDDGQYTVMWGRYEPTFTVVRGTPDKGFDRNLIWLGDFNGDSLTDVLTRPHGASTFVTYFSNGDGTFNSVRTDQPEAWDETVRLGDFNGDGRTDVFAYRESGNFRFKTFFSNGDGTFNLVKHDMGDNWTSSLPLNPGDFNADGLTDFIFDRDNNWYIWQANGLGGFIQKTIPHAPGYSFRESPVVGDFNGDGISDMMRALGSKLMVFLFDGANGFTVVENETGISNFVLRADMVGEINGDQCADILSWFNPGGRTDLVRFLSAKNGVFTKRVETTSVAWDPANGVWIGDFDGEGKADILAADTEFARLVSNQFNDDMLCTVENAHGGTTEFRYKALTDATVYTKGSETVYPCHDFQASFFVVSSVVSRNGIDGDGYLAPAPGDVGTNTVHYTYEGAWSCLFGRGFQGFKAVQKFDENAGIHTRTEFESWSEILLGGKPNYIAQWLENPPEGGSSLISEKEVNFDIYEFPKAGGRPSTYLLPVGNSVTKTYDTNRPKATALLTTTTTGGPAEDGMILYDDFGNLLESTTTTTDGTETFTETVVNTYDDQVTPTKWYLGRLATSTVTKTGPSSTGAGTETITRSSSFEYDEATGLLTREVIEPGGGNLRQQKDYTHDAFGNILTSTISVAGEDPRTTTTTYTPDGRFVATTTNSVGHTESKTYDPLLGNVLTQTGPNGLTTSWHYDSIGRPTRETRPDGTETRSFYRLVTATTENPPPRAVHYVRVHSTSSAPKTVWYDLLDREIRTDGIAFDGRTVSAHKVLNARGEVEAASLPYFAEETPLYSYITYDELGRVAEQLDPGNRITRHTYAGFTTTVERNHDAAAPTQFQKAESVVNAMGWTIRSSQYLGTAPKTVTNRYDPYGNLRFVTDPAGNATELRYDRRGNKVWMSEPNTGVSTFIYNGFGELIAQTNSAGQPTLLSYDRLGRVVSRTEPEGTTTFIYDTSAKGIGQLARESSPSFTRSFYYDSLARPASTTETHGYHTFATSRSYDPAGRPDSLTYPTGFATRQVYTANGHLSEVQNAADPSTLYWRALEVNSRGQVTQETLGNGVKTTRTFNEDDGMIQSIYAIQSDAEYGFQDLAFEFDLLGNLTARHDYHREETFSETFLYDTLNRLQSVTTTGLGTVSAAYNDIGNITSRSDVGTFAYSGTRPHALSSVSGGGGTYNKTCSYDAKGNRTDDGDTKLTYSSFNKPILIRKGGDRLSFDYGPDRSLFRQTIFRSHADGSTSHSVREYVGGFYERETNSQGLGSHTHYIAGGNGVVAIHTDERSATTSSQRTRYIHKDHLGSVDAITDNSGEVVERQSFDAWGRKRSVIFSSGNWSVSYPSTPSPETHRGFTGHEMLDLVNLVHMGGRVYDPITARFLSPDPFVQSPDNLQNLNRYTYVLNNPLSFTDPSGFFLKSLAKLFLKIAKPLQIVATVLSVFPATRPIGMLLSQFVSFGSAFSATLLSGGSVSDALRAGVKAYAINVATQTLTSRIGQAYETGRITFATRVAAHGVVNGASRAAQGGEFRHGFYAGSFVAAFSPGVERIDSALGTLAGTAAAGLIGGTAERIGGGKFSNGAATGAMIHIFNDLAHREALRKQFGITNENYGHSYSAQPGFVCSMSDPECTPESVFDFIAQRKWLWAPLGDNSLINLCQANESSLNGGNVTHNFDRSSLTYYNITRPGHFFYGGFIERSVMTIDGSIYITTYGEGVNSFGRGVINQISGPLIFRSLDSKVKDAWDAAH